MLVYVLFCLIFLYFLFTQKKEDDGANNYSMPNSSHYVRFLPYISILILSIPPVAYYFFWIPYSNEKKLKFEEKKELRKNIISEAETKIANRIITYYQNNPEPFNTYNSKIDISNNNSQEYKFLCTNYSLNDGIIELDDIGSKIELMEKIDSKSILKYKGLLLHLSEIKVEIGYHELDENFDCYRIVDIIAPTLMCKGSIVGTFPVYSDFKDEYGDIDYQGNNLYLSESNIYKMVLAELGDGYKILFDSKQSINLPPEVLVEKILFPNLSKELNTQLAAIEEKIKKAKGEDKPVLYQIVEKDGETYIITPNSGDIRTELNKLTDEVELLGNNMDAYEGSFDIINNSISSVYGIDLNVEEDYSTGYNVYKIKNSNTQQGATPSQTTAPQSKSPYAKPVVTPPTTTTSQTTAPAVDSTTITKPPFIK